MKILPFVLFLSICSFAQAQEVVFKSKVDERLVDISTLIHEKYVMLTGRIAGGYVTFKVLASDQPTVTFKLKRKGSTLISYTSSVKFLTIYFQSTFEDGPTKYEYILYDKEFNRFTNTFALALATDDEIIDFVPDGEDLYVVAKFWNSDKLFITQFQEGKQVFRKEFIVDNPKLLNIIKQGEVRYIEPDCEPTLGQASAQNKLYFRDGQFCLFASGDKAVDPDKVDIPVLSVEGFAIKYKTGELTTNTFFSSHSGKGDMNSFLYQNELYTLMFSKQVIELRVFDWQTNERKALYRFEKGQPNTLKMTPLMRDDKNIEKWPATVDRNEKIHDALDKGLPIVGVWSAGGGSKRMLLGSLRIETNDGGTLSTPASTVTTSQGSVTLPGRDIYTYSGSTSSTATTFFSYLNGDFTLGGKPAHNGAYEQVDKRKEDKKELKIVDYSIARVSGGVCFVYLDKSNNLVVEKYKSE